MIRVVIADDHAVVRHGLAQLLSTFPDVELVGEAADGEVAVVMCAEHRPDVVLMDLEMPSLDGIEATKRIKPTSQTWPSSSSRRSRTGTGSCRRSTRAAATIAEGRRTAELAKAIESAARGDAPLDPRAARTVLGARQAAALPRGSRTEREVLLLVAEGLPNKLIARRLDISEKTVKAHLTSVFRQIGVTDRTQAALWAERNGITGRGS